MLGHVESREDSFSTCRLFSVSGQIVSEDEMQLTHRGIHNHFDYRIILIVFNSFFSISGTAVGAWSTRPIYRNIPEIYLDHD